MHTAFLVIVNPNSREGSVNVGFHHSFTATHRIPIDLEIANGLIAAFSRLPAGGGDLCFNPVFVIELRTNKRLDWAGAACFDCGTYCSTDGSGPANGTFDQNSAAAKDLLNQMRALA